MTIDYPALIAERNILDLVLQEAVEALTPSEAPTPISKADLAEARRLVLDVHLSDPIRDYIVRLISGTRGDPESLNGVDEHLSHPVSPRGSVSLARTAQARAWLMERDHVLPEDVQALVFSALRHRMGLTYRAEADGVTPDQIIESLVEQVSVV